MLCQKFSPKGETCSLCLQTLPVLRSIIPFGYSAVVKALFAVYKYQEAFRYKRVIAELVEVYASLDPFLLFQNFQQSFEYILIPVPMHIKKYQIRGFSPAIHVAVILEEVLKKRGIVVSINSSLVHKVKETEKQAGKSKQARLQNQHNVFAVNNQALKKLAIRSNKVLIIVDDITSTGATLSSVAETILTSIKEHRHTIPIWCFAFARG